MLASSKPSAPCIDFDASMQNVLNLLAFNTPLCLGQAKDLFQLPDHYPIHNWHPGMDVPVDHTLVITSEEALQLSKADISHRNLLILFTDDYLTTLRAQMMLSLKLGLKFDKYFVSPSFQMPVTLASFVRVNIIDYYQRQSGQSSLKTQAKCWLKGLLTLSNLWVRTC